MDKAAAISYPQEKEEIILKLVFPRIRLLLGFTYVEWLINQ